MQRRFVEEVRIRVGDVLEGAVQLGASRSRVHEIANGDFVTDDEDHLLVAREQPLERARVAKRRLVEALAAGETLLPVRVRRRLAVGVERGAFELADVDVAEIVVDEVRDLAAVECDVGGLDGAGDGEIATRSSGSAASCPARRSASSIPCCERPRSSVGSPLTSLSTLKSDWPCRATRKSRIAGA